MEEWKLCVARAAGASTLPLFHSSTLPLPRREAPCLILVAVEAKLLEEGEDLRQLEGTDAGGFQGEGERRVALEGDELAGKRQVGARLLQVLAPLALDLVEVGED